MNNALSFEQQFTDFSTLSDSELESVEGGRNKLAYNMGHYAGKATIFGLAAWALLA
ncbi:bacteriocin [Lactiplantibacillus pentosus]|uniref:Plantaricin S alpha protein n=2 Tax=Lactiplantibacillus TaxID=2767842 RepID=O32831_LACPN|nr:bacteriocin [Lactiplantibacillus pentosus]MCT3301688.1 bacteriocin [Lactiplantibacillus pentosus]CAA75397.1 plantaricin S alpha protein [Lactiplantibacillus plantarum]CCC17008.1 plantaricin S alpha protein [Lactiplantibacillus pentosus IG1]